MAHEPLFRTPLHVGRPNLGDRAAFLARIEGALDRLYLTDGPLVREFEEALAAVTGVDHCVAVCNATVGIQIAARACGVEPGDEVIVPSFTWVATAHALSWIGVVPVFCDVDLESGNADPDHVARLITPRTKGILGVHVFGRPCPVKELTDVADRAVVPLMFDAAHGLGSTYDGRPVGGFGDVEILSFHATKFLNSFEGGAVVTNDPGIARRARAMRNFGITENRDVEWAGTNGKMNEAVAAMGLTSLEVIDDIMATNLRNHDVYEAGLAEVPGVTLRRQALGERANHQYLVIEVDPAEAGVDREAVFDALLRENVLARRYFHPACHDVEPYASNRAVHAPLPLPNSELLASRVLALPTGTSIGPDEITAICGIVRDAVAAGPRPRTQDGD